MKISKQTPVLVVPAVEPSLAFWRDRLGFTVTMEVPHGDGLGFVALERDGIELMVQSGASVRDDMAGADGCGGDAFLYLKVDSVDEVARALDGVPVAVPRRRAPYGAHEVGYREPGGHLICFADRR